ncbi:MAG: TetR/AcrR family transcriptional regulator [Nevskiaceae bacterium]|nr:MAG: TetR/AcrR family transcriptional regulator [Nevskiaceae bacterium]
MRKKPKQQRSQSLVQSLIDAAAETIAEHGLAAATAARIAERAGVSVGSLYQYFESKEQIHTAVIEHIATGLRALVHAQIEQLPQKGIRDFVQDLLHEVWNFLEADDQRYLQITRHWAQLDFVQVMNGLERQMTMALAVYVMHHPPRQPVEDLPAKVYILVNSVLFTVVRYISDPAPHVTREQIIRSFAQAAAQLMNQDESR